MSRSWLIFPLLALYLLNLGGVGFLGPDEPRYASVAREMIQSHDLVTPRLDGRPWFEKPPLLYWMTAAGRLARLSDEWAARLPVALVSIALLFFFYVTLAGEFSPRTALAATTILATSAGWLAYSFVAVTDLPMAAALTAAMLIAMYDTRRKQGYIAGALLGLAILAKGFVPLVLFVPLFLIARGKRLTMLAGAVVVAAPWYVLCAARNGPMFWHEFFWKQHVERFFTPELAHVQPFWYYLPVILAGLFPWTPLAALLARARTYHDVRVRFLIVWIVYALIFFSAARNKLPGYALPILPPLAIVLAVALEKTRTAAKWWLAGSTAMLAALPLVVAALPTALLSGVRNAPIHFALGFPFLLAAGLVWWLAWREQYALAIAAIAITVVGAMIYVKVRTFPELDRTVSVRGFWREHGIEIDQACVARVRRQWIYGLNYYAGHPLSDCAPGDMRSRVVEQAGSLMIQR